MSILIKGMEMPKCCAECDVEGHYENCNGDEYGFFCPFGYKAYTEKTRDAKRFDNCPLIPVPEHGRLIDADALTAKFKEMGLGEHSLIERLFADGVYVMIDYAPTIIPAEEGE